jgi:hypothetical protein
MIRELSLHAVGTLMIDAEAVERRSAPVDGSRKNSAREESAALLIARDSVSRDRRRAI